VSNLSDQERTMRKFSSYGPLNTKLHYYAPRTGLIDQALGYLLGEQPDEGGHYITISPSGRPHPVKANNEQNRSRQTGGHHNGQAVFEPDFHRNWRAGFFAQAHRDHIGR
jgi:hypothetical protein